MAGARERGCTTLYMVTEHCQAYEITYNLPRAQPGIEELEAQFESSAAARRPLPATFDAPGRPMKKTARMHPQGTKSDL